MKMLFFSAIAASSNHSFYKMCLGITTLFFTV